MRQIARLATPEEFCGARTIAVGRSKERSERIDDRWDRLVDLLLRLGALASDRDEWLAKEGADLLANALASFGASRKAGQASTPKTLEFVCRLYALSLGKSIVADDPSIFETDWNETKTRLVECGLSDCWGWIRFPPEDLKSLPRKTLSFLRRETPHMCLGGAEAP